jgi:hypothetical protein
MYLVEAFAGVVRHVARLGQGGLLLLASSTGCAVAASEQTAATESEIVTPLAVREVVFYVGTSTTTSPDGSTPYGPPVTVIARRTVDPDDGTIRELVVHPGRTFPTTLERVPGTNDFHASDEAGSFTGTLTFSGREWAWDAWSYDISMTDGSGALRGRGTRTKVGMDTDKTFFDPSGEPRARMREHFDRVDEATFEAKRAELLAP